MSIYSRHAPTLWRDRNTSTIEALMQSYQAENATSNQRTTAAKDKISRIAHEEDKYEVEMLNIRNFGYHWLKPIGISKTMGQIEDEAREIQESFEEYEDEDNQFNQNNPEAPAGVEGQDIMSEEGPEHEDAEAPDLDENIEEGASFDVGETSYVSSASPAAGRPHAGLRDVDNISINGSQPNSEGEDASVDQDAEAGMLSAEEGSIGDYSSDAEGSNPESD